LDAVAFVLDLREGQVDFGNNAGDVEALDVADAALLGGLEVGADLGEAGVVVADCHRAGGDAKGEDGGDESDGGEMHFDFFLVVVVGGVEVKIRDREMEIQGMCL
jgi:hypothetical protein